MSHQASINTPDSSADSQRNGQRLIDIADQFIMRSEAEIPRLLTLTTHKYHRLAAFAAVRCDNVAAIEYLVPTTNPAVQCCAVLNGAIHDILRVDQRNSLTMTCIEYDSIGCFKYLHAKTGEPMDVVIAKAIRYGAQKILTFLASTTTHADSIQMQARKAGLQLRICV